MSRRLLLRISKRSNPHGLLQARKFDSCRAVSLCGSMFVLSGEDLTLPSAEVRALIQTYNTDSTCEQLGQRVIVSDLQDDELIRKITSRAAFCRFGGSLLSTGEKLEDLVGDNFPTIPSEMTFAVASNSLDRSMCGELGALIKSKTNARVSLDTPDIVFQLESTESKFVLGSSDQGYKKSNWRERRPRARRFFLPSAIYPKLARFLVNLSRIKEGEYFLDPFCGTGSLLIESSVMGIKTLGIDMTRWIARGALLNLKGFALDFESIVRADSTGRNLPVQSIDAIATDVPYGRASSTKGKETAQIIQEFTRAAAEALDANGKREKYCVIMHPSHVELAYDRKSFELCEQHMLYVHRNLTRAISVLRRTH